MQNNEISWEDVTAYCSARCLSIVDTGLLKEIHDNSNKVEAMKSGINSLIDRVEHMDDDYIKKEKVLSVIKGLKGLI